MGCESAVCVQLIRRTVMSLSPAPAAVALALAGVMCLSLCESGLALAVAHLNRPATGLEGNASETDVMAFRNLLDLMLSMRLPAEPTIVPATDRVPQKLLDLLEDLALSRHSPWAKQVQGLPTAVKSALPRPYGPNTTILTFEVDIPADEYLVRAELYLFRSPVSALSSNAPGKQVSRLMLQEYNGYSFKSMGPVHIAAAPISSPDWHSVDVTASVRGMRVGQPQPRVVVVRFETPSSTTVPANAYLAQLGEAANAFLLLITASQEHSKVDTHKIAEALLKVQKHDPRIIQHVLDRAPKNNLLKTRRRRSIINNELDEEEGDTIPMPARSRSFSRRKSNRRNKKHEEVCRRRRLDVRFSDLGWQDWILWPSTFSAHYCAGQCPFPLTKAMRPTNHASIQSLARALGLARVPAPGCVPDQLEPLTLLYRDATGAVVLRSYPNMRVATCACR